MSRRTTRRNYTERLGNPEDDVETKVSDQEIVNEEEDEEIDEEDEQEITRCVCGNDDLNVDTINENVENLLEEEYQIKIDQGLFIQCDKCSVWQHGYCVGLFTNDDVPDKYWCELCKPDLHILIHETNDRSRTLYKPANEKRKKLWAETEKHIKRKFTRKDRRGYDYDEQLQKALRESAKENKPVEEDKKPSSKTDDREPTKEVIDGKSEVESDSRTRNGNENETGVGDEEDEVEGDGEGEADREAGAEAEAEGEEDEENSDIKKEAKKKTMKRVKRKESRPKPKKQKVDSNNTNGLTKEDLLSQSSKPRFVNDRSSIYELRKRISAILEWLSRSQLELEEEKLAKVQMTNDASLTNSYDTNLTLMQSLTVKILEWEEKYGKFAP